MDPEGGGSWIQRGEGHGSRGGRVMDPEGERSGGSRGGVMDPEGGGSWIPGQACTCGLQYAQGVKPGQGGVKGKQPRVSHVF